MKIEAIENALADKKQEIAWKAFGIFLKKTFLKTSMQDIMKATGMSKGGIYHYFGSKEEILDEAIELIVQDKSNYLKELTSRTDINSKEKIMSWFDEMMDTIQIEKEIVIQLFGNPENEIIINRLKNRMCGIGDQFIVDIINKGIKDKDFDFDHPFETIIIYQHSIHSIMDLISEGFIDKDNIEVYIKIIRKGFKRLFDIE